MPEACSEAVRLFGIRFSSCPTAVFALDVALSVFAAVPCRRQA